MPGVQQLKVFKPIKIYLLALLNRLRGRVVKGMGHLDHVLKLRCAGGREFNPRPGQYSRMSFSS